MKKPVTIEPFHIVRARRMRREAWRRYALGMAFATIVMALGGSLGL
ncbi:MAG: hypothetical protein Q8K13_10430 [Parvibaculum sp.]|nr:hypothetical protein [Parvibaculum sp.]MDP2150044.1 hypothetical protein [Parvibaculum sp.]